MSDFPALDAKVAEYKAVRQDVEAVVNEGGGMKGLDWSRVTSLKGTADEKRDWLREKNAQLTDLYKSIEVLQATKANLDATVADALDSEAKLADVTLGDAFVKSAAYSGRRQRVEATGEVGMKTLFERPNGWEPESTRQAGILLSAQRPAPSVVNAIPSGSINQVAYKYMEETTFTNAAAEVAEGGAYAEATLEATEKSLPVEKIAVYLSMTDEQLDDVAEARAYVNDRLGLMLAQRVDLQILAGNGTAPNLMGTKNVVGIQTDDATGDDPFDALANMQATIRSGFLGEVSNIFMNEATWVSQFQLAKDGNGLYILGGPGQAGPRHVWGVPVLTTEVLAAGEVIMGDYRTHARFLVKRGVQFQVTNSHSDYFIKGKQAVRAELRAVMVHLRPGAFARLTNVGVPTP